jgi:hypothetical protein
MLRLYKRSGNGKKSFDSAECDIVTSNKPVWYVFTGDGANADKDINGYLKFVVDIQKNKLKREYDINDLYDKVDFCGIKYSDKKSNIGGKPKYSMTSDDLTMFIYYRLIPLFYGKNNKLLKKSEIIKNLSSINIFSHCYGNGVVFDIFEQLVEIILNQAKIEYYCECDRVSDVCDENDVRECLTAIRHITYAPINEKINLPTIRIRPLKDSIVEDGELLPYVYKEHYGDFLDGVNIKMYNVGEGLIGKNNDCVKAQSVDVYSSQMMNRISGISEHMLFQLKKDDNGDVVPMTVLPWFEYATQNIVCENAEDVSNILEVAMSDATKCSLDNYHTPQNPVILKTDLEELKIRFDMINNSYLADDIKVNANNYQIARFENL